MILEEKSESEREKEEESERPESKRDILEVRPWIVGGQTVERWLMKGAKEGKGEGQRSTPKNLTLSQIFGENGEMR